MSNTKKSLVIRVKDIVYNPNGVSVCQKDTKDQYFTKGIDCINHYLHSHMRDDLDQYVRNSLDHECCKEEIDQASYSFINHYLRCSGIGSKIRLEMISDCAAIFKLVPKNANDSKTLALVAYPEKLKISQQEQHKIEAKYDQVLKQYSKSISENENSHKEGQNSGHESRPKKAQTSNNQPLHHTNLNKSQTTRDQSCVQKDPENEKKNAENFSTKALAINVVLFAL